MAYHKTEKADLCWSAMVETGVPFIGKGVAYHRTEETNLLRSKWGHVDLEGCGVPQNIGNGSVLERYGRNRGPVHQEGCGVPQNGTPRDTVHLDPLQPPRATVHPPSTSSSLHLRLFIHGLLFIQPPPCATPPATVQPALSMGSCSTAPPRATVHPALHRLLFILPSTGWSCSSSPPRGLVHPAPTGTIDRGTVHPAATASTTTGSCSSNPPWELFIHPPTTLTVHP